MAKGFDMAIRKHLSALLICLQTVFSLEGLLPATALAADGDTVYVGSVELTGSTDSPAYATTDDSGRSASCTVTVTHKADDPNYQAPTNPTNPTDKDESTVEETPNDESGLPQTGDSLFSYAVIFTALIVLASGIGMLAYRKLHRR